MRIQTGLCLPTPFVWGSCKAYYPFGESTGQGNATCPLQSPRQQDLPEWRYTAHYSFTPSAPESASSEAVKRRQLKNTKNKTGTVSQYELGWLKVRKSTFLETSASKGCFFPPSSQYPCRSWHYALYWLSKVNFTFKVYTMKCFNLKKCFTDPCKMCIQPKIIYTLIKKRKTFINIKTEFIQTY